MVPYPKREISLEPYQRVRKDDQIVAVLPEEWLTYKVCPDPNMVYGSSYVKPALNGTTMVMSDYVVPRFRSRVAAGERFFNNMFREEITVSTTGNSVKWRGVPDVCSPPAGRKVDSETRKAPITLNWLPTESADIKGRYFPVISTLLSDAEVTRAQQEVSTEVLAKVGTADSDLWESVAEYRQAIALLENPLSRIESLSSRIISAAERSRTSRALLKEVADGYLMYRYGITPLMKDIKSILSSLDKEGGKKEVSSRAKTQVAAHGVVTGNTIKAGYASCLWSNQIDDVVTVRGMSLDEGYVSFANNLGFTLKGLLILPIQLTSYSFVADWFVNLSSFVQATLPTFGWKHLGASLTTTRVTANGYTLGAYTNLASGTRTFSATPTGGTCGIVRLTKIRTPLLPAAFVTKSDFRFDKFTRVADTVGLLVNRFAGISRLAMGPSNRRLAFRNKRAYENWADTLNYSRQST